MADALRVEVEDRASAAPRVALHGPLDRAAVPAVRLALRPLLIRRGASVRLSLANVNSIDTAGGALLAALHAEATRAGATLRLTDASPAAAEALRRTPAPPATAEPRGPGLFEALGEAAAAARASAFAFLVLTADTVGLAFGGAPRTRRVRRGATAVEALRIGVDAVPIVALVSFLVGLVVALQSALQLSRFGASVYVADLIAVSMTREMGPLMTAILVAGRSGASIAAEIATMQVSEEVDALRAMGLEPVRYLVVPKFLGISLTMPLLVAFANLFGILGGFFVSLLYLDIGPLAFFNQVGVALNLKDVLTGLAKSLAFAWIIVLVGAHRGFSARGGAESVGLVTTSSVVASIFWVIVADAAFSLVFYFV